MRRTSSIATNELVSVSSSNASKGPEGRPGHVRSSRLAMQFAASPRIVAEPVRQVKKTQSGLSAACCRAALSAEQLSGGRASPSSRNQQDRAEDVDVPTEPNAATPLSMRSPHHAGDLSYRPRCQKRWAARKAAGNPSKCAGRRPKLQRSSPRSPHGLTGRRSLPLL